MNNNCVWLTNGLYISPKDKEGKISNIKSCCRAKHDKISFHSLEQDQYLQNLSISSELISEHVSKLSEQKYNYQKLKDSVCRICASEEKSQKRSMRIGSNSLYGNKIKQPGKIQLLGIAFGNFCNFKCRYCVPKFSTSWNKDIPEMEKFKNQPVYNLFDYYGYSTFKMNEFDTFNYEKWVIGQLEKQDLTDLLEVGVFGGEPFMMRHWEQFIELLHEKSTLSNIKIEISTNASVIPNKRIVELLSRFKEVELRISVEAVDKLAEYVRTGLNWNTLQKNIKKWQEIAKEHSNIWTRIHMANNVYNINKVLDFEEWLLDMNLNHNVVVAYVYDPEILDPRNCLTKPQLTECIKRIQSSKIPQIKKELVGILENVSADSQSQKKFQNKLTQFTTAMDKIRNTKLKDVNLELWEWINE